MITSTKVKLREKRLADALDDYAWRTDVELAKLDAAQVLTTTFHQYLADYTCELHHPPPKRHPFAIETAEGKHIGNCVYYNVNKVKGDAELGIMIGDRTCWDKGYGAEAVATLLGHIFGETKLDRVYLKTLESNQRAKRCFEKCDFITYSHLKKDGHDFVLMEIYRQRWENDAL